MVALRSGRNLGALAQPPASRRQRLDAAPNNADAAAMVRAARVAEHSEAACSSTRELMAADSDACASLLRQLLAETLAFQNSRSPLIQLLLANMDTREALFCLLSQPALARLGKTCVAANDVCRAHIRGRLDAVLDADIEAGPHRALLCDFVSSEAATRFNFEFFPPTDPPAAHAVQDALAEAIVGTTSPLEDTQKRCHYVLAVADATIAHARREAMREWAPPQASETMHRDRRWLAGCADEVIFASIDYVRDLGTVTHSHLFRHMARAGEPLKVGFVQHNLGVSWEIAQRLFEETEAAGNTSIHLVSKKGLSWESWIGLVVGTRPSALSRLSSRYMLFSPTDRPGLPISRQAAQSDYCLQRGPSTASSSSRQKAWEKARRSREPDDGETVLTGCLEALGDPAHPIFPIANEIDWKRRLVRMRVAGETTPAHDTARPQFGVSLRMNEMARVMSAMAGRTDPGANFNVQSLMQDEEDESDDY